METKMYSAHPLETGLSPIMDMSSSADFFAAFMDRPSCMFSSSPTSVSPNVNDLNMNTKENIREISQCKRKLDFAENNNYLGLQRPQTVSVARRNERERNRVKLINMTFATLREHIPQLSKGGKSRKLSKVETLRAAIEYIRYLQGMMDENTTVDLSKIVSEGCLSPGLSTGTSVNSPSSPSGSPASESSYENLSTEEEDLLDFANWF
ncbi:achaete-scute homolog 1a [Patella vulgata]|uniref:achaete-scute homolog 1a n=1 Tax=Patella vulgata TaxID=6465 RepID=UPI00217F8B37|nr:achaete-scute homolog 1a [Patella vulgata]